VRPVRRGVGPAGLERWAARRGRAGWRNDLGAAVGTTGHARNKVKENLARETIERQAGA